MVCLTGSYLAHSGLKLLVLLKRRHDLQLNLSIGRRFQRVSPLSLRWGGCQHAGRQSTGDIAESCILICKQRELGLEWTFESVPSDTPSPHRLILMILSNSAAPGDQVFTYMAHGDTTGGTRTPSLLRSPPGLQMASFLCPCLAVRQFKFLMK